MAAKQVCILLGAGPGLGAALAEAFAPTHSIALLARNKDSLLKIKEQVAAVGGTAEVFAADATSPASLDAAFSAIAEAFPGAKVTNGLFNVNPPFKSAPFLELTEKDVRGGVELTVLGAFHFSQRILPLLLETPGSSLIFTGATASLKGGAKLAAFAPSKFALRGLAQSLAREFGPKEVHVSHVILDALVDTPIVRKMLGAADNNEGKRLNPKDIAEVYVHLAQQPRSAWTQEIDLRPYSETF